MIGKKKQTFKGFMVAQSNGELELNTFSESKKETLDKTFNMFFVSWETLSIEGFTLEEVELTVKIIK